MRQTTLSSVGLPSVYDQEGFSEEEFQREVITLEFRTEIERHWLAESELEMFPTDEHILAAASLGKLMRINSGGGFVIRDFLNMWEPERSDSSHAFHYSPPFLRKEAAETLSEISDNWQRELGPSRFLSVTSLIRSMEYQQSLATQSRKLTIPDAQGHSSHLAGIAFDIDGCGLKQRSDDGALRSVNPRMPGFDHSLVKESRLVLRHILENNKRDGVINFVEELPGTQEHCFHICVNPNP